MISSAKYIRYRRKADGEVEWGSEHKTGTHQSDRITQATNSSLICIQASWGILMSRDWFLGLIGEADKIDWGTKVLYDIDLYDVK
jgi:hypothetical protein